MNTQGNGNNLAGTFSNTIIATSNRVGINFLNGSYPSYALDVRGQVWARSTLYIGSNDSNNEIRFYGTTGDSPGTFAASVIAERIYGGTEQSELLLFKGNDTGSSGAGPDRVRVLASGGFQVDCAPTGNWSEGGAPPTPSFTNCLVVRGTNGFVGIGKNNPSVALDVTGSVAISGALSKGSGSFEINHPILPSTTLVHSFIEGPRCDLIYRGRKQLSSGMTTIDLESESTANGSKMTPGTFEALCTNPQVYLQNNETYDRVKGHVSANILMITSENSNSSTYIDWMVIAERCDPFIKTWNRTDSNGLLVLEHPV